MKVAKRLQWEKRVRQCDIAAACGVSTATVNAWLTGRSRPDNAMAGRVLDHLEATREERRLTWVEMGVPVGDLA